MNQSIATPEFESARIPPLHTAEKATNTTKLNVDLAALKALLMEGENALAKRKDIGELHKRIITALTTLNQGLGEAQAMRVAEDRTQLIAKLDEVERAINSMEGALRIELEPMLRNIVHEAAEQLDARPRRLWRMSSIAAVFFAIGLAVGAFYAQSIVQLYVNALPLNPATLNGGTPELPQNGGSVIHANQVN
ncbi:MAG: hypothetical protein WCC57_13570 [Paracoccaceae bacterium]